MQKSGAFQNSRKTPNSGPMGMPYKSNVH